MVREFRNKIMRKLLNLYLTYLVLSPFIISAIPLILYRFFSPEVIFLLIISIPVGFSFHKKNSFDGKNHRKVRKFRKRYEKKERKMMDVFRY
jgi:hypothetical protein